MFKAKNKNKMRKDNQLCEIEIREVDNITDNEKKRIKIHYKGFRATSFPGFCPTRPMERETLAPWGG